jgi:RNase H-fold protein (predicted Holliday junction resolvase)
MSIVIAIDPGLSKCGVVIADIKEKRVYEAVVIKSHLVLKYVKKKYQSEKSVQLLIGNGTGSKNYIKYLNQFEPDLIIAEEKNSTYRAKQRYFDIFPLIGIRCFLPRELFILNKNLDALAALIIMEDFFNIKFDVSKNIKTKTWLK